MCKFGIRRAAAPYFFTLHYSLNRAPPGTRGGRGIREAAPYISKERCGKIEESVGAGLPDSPFREHSVPVSEAGDELIPWSQYPPSDE